MESITKSAAIGSYSEKDHSVIVRMTTNEVDLDGDIVEPEGLDTDWWDKQGSVLWGHDMRSFPIGRPLWPSKIVEENGKISRIVKIGFNPHTPEGRAVEAMVKDGFIKNFSIRFIPTEEPDVRRDMEGRPSGYHYKKSRLLELSAVNVPANPSANALSMQDVAEFMISKGMEDVVDRVGIVKGAVPYKDFPAADEGRAWDKSAALKRWQEYSKSGDKIDFSKYKYAFAWFDSKDPEKLGSYKLPHLDIIDGKPHVIWAGVRAAMAALMGARGGVDIPSEDRKPVYNLLAKRYKLFDKEPPEFKEYGQADLMKIFPEEYGAESVIMDEVEKLKMTINISNEAIQKALEKFDMLTVYLRSLEKALETLSQKDSSSEKPKGRTLSAEELASIVRGEVRKLNGEVTDDMLEGKPTKKLGGKSGRQ